MTNRADRIRDALELFKPDFSRPVIDTMPAILPMPNMFENDYEEIRKAARDLETVLRSRVLDEKKPLYPDDILSDYDIAQNALRQKVLELIGERE